jgi:hypothetical protein
MSFDGVVIHQPAMSQKPRRIPLVLKGPVQRAAALLSTSSTSGMQVALTPASAPRKAFYRHIKGLLSSESHRLASLELSHPKWRRAGLESEGGKDRF